MTGFGIRRQVEAARQLGEVRQWREESFLQQLSLNGSLMLADNHDRLWLDKLTNLMHLSSGSSWSFIQSVLRTLPASVARRLLWRASWQWLVESELARTQTIERARQGGYLASLLAKADMRSQADRLSLTAWQLDVLAWVLEDDEQETIGIVDAEHQGLPPRRRPLA